MALHPNSQGYGWTFRRVMWATLVIVLIAIGFWLFHRLYKILFIVFAAVVMGTVIRPVVTWLHRRGLPRLAGVILVNLLMLSLIIGFILILFPLIVEQGTTVAGAIPGYYRSLHDWMAEYPNPFVVRLSKFLPTLSGEKTLQQTGPEVLASAGKAMNYAASAAKVIFMTTAILLLAFHWTLEGPRTIRSLLLLFPKKRRESINELISDIETKVGFYVAGQGVLCLCIGVMSAAAYLTIGLPNALVLALAASVLEVVPMIGPMLGAIPAAAIALAISPSKLLWVIVATIIIQEIENNFLVPRVMRKAVGVNPFVSLLALFAFSSLFGIAGAIMAIPIAAIIQLLLDRLVFYPEAAEPEVSSGRDYACRLRYEAQEFVRDLRKQARIKKGGSDIKVGQMDQVMDEIESIATDLDTLLAQDRTTGVR